MFLVSFFSLDLVEDCGLSALLIASFYGHIDCVCAILEYPSDEMTEVVNSQLSDATELKTIDERGEEGHSGGGEINDPKKEGMKGPEAQNNNHNTATAIDQSFTDSFSSICPVDALRCAPMNWCFRREGSNTLVIGPMRRSVGKHFIGASFNCLHLAIITG